MVPGTGLRIAVESWSPDYGSPFEAEGAQAEPQVDLDVEIRSAHWGPVDPSRHARPVIPVMFVDGVRRIDAVTWITSDAGQVWRGICASYAAGAVFADGRARIEGIRVRRELFTSAPAPPLATRAGAYEPVAAVGDEPDTLSLALQERLGALEIEVAAATRGRAALIVVDGPLSGRQNVPGAVGYVKTHRREYLQGLPAATVAALRAGQRTPVFLTRTSWTRYSWYARLPGPAGHPWAGVVRLEASADRPVEEAIALADRASVTLLPFASTPHKDARAPQNLFPIAGLERELRHRLGDAGVMERALRAAAAGGAADAATGTPPAADPR